MTMGTTILGLILVGLTVKAIGYERIREGLTRTRALAVAGFSGGIMFGQEVVMTLISDPFAGTTLLAGVGGALLGGVTRMQLAMLVVVIVLAIWLIGGDE